MVNNQDFIRSVAKTTGYTMKDIEIVIKAMPEVIANALKEDDTVKVFPGITFKAKTVAAHEQKSPFDGTIVNVPEKRQAKVTFSESFKSLLN